MWSRREGINPSAWDRGQAQHAGGTGALGMGPSAFPNTEKLRQRACDKGPEARWF